MLLFDMMPDLAKHMVKDLELDLEVYTVKWFFSFFCIDLPFEYVLSILDLYMVEQITVFIRVALAIFQSLKDQLMAVRYQEDIHLIF